jgi:hypothetical protein
MCFCTTDQSPQSPVTTHTCDETTASFSTDQSTTPPTLPTPTELAFVTTQNETDQVTTPIEPFSTHAQTATEDTPTKLPNTPAHTVKEQLASPAEPTLPAITATTQPTVELPPSTTAISTALATSVPSTFTPADRSLLELATQKQPTKRGWAKYKLSIAIRPFMANPEFGLELSPTIKASLIPMLINALIAITAG